MYFSPLLLLLILAAFSEMASCKTFTPRTSPDLKAALTSAQPGDVITLLPINYEGEFNLNTVSDSSSTDGNPAITLQGTHNEKTQNHSTIIPINGNGITISGNHHPWHLTSLVIQSSSHGGSGVVINGSGHVLRSLVINGGRVGVALHGDNNVVNSTTISNTVQGIVINGSGNSVRGIAMNDGIIVEAKSNGTDIRGVSIQMDNSNGISLTLKEGSMGSILYSTTLNGIANLSGNDGYISSTVFSGVNLFGCGNTFSSTMIQSMYQKQREQGNAACNNNFDQSTMVGMWSDEQLQ